MNNRIVKIALIMMVSLNTSFIASALGVEELHAAKKVELPFIGTDSPAGQAVIAFHKALKTGDAESARAFLADNVLIFEGKGVERSADQYANHHMLSDMKYLAEVTTVTLEHTVKVSGNFAVSMMRSKTTGTYKGKDRNYEGNETMTLSLVNGKWLITHIHWSH